MCQFHWWGCCGGPPVGAVVQQQMMTLTVEAPAGNIPQQFEVDISEMSIDNPVRVSDIDFGSGVVPQTEEDSLIAIGQRSRASIGRRSWR